MSNYDGEDLNALLGAVPPTTWIKYAILVVVGIGCIVGLWVMTP